MVEECPREAAAEMTEGQEAGSSCRELPQQLWPSVKEATSPQQLSKEGARGRNNLTSLISLPVEAQSGVDKGREWI